MPKDHHHESLERELDAPDAKGFRAIGQPIRRKEDARLLTGQGRFSDDFSRPGQVYAAMVRSPYPHARIKGIDKESVKDMPGVLGVFTGEDAAAAGFKPIPHSPLPSTKYDMKLAGPNGGTPCSTGRICCCPPTRRATSARPSPWWSRRPSTRPRTPPRRWRSTTRSCRSTPRRRRPATARPRCGTRSPTTCWSNLVRRQGGDRACLCRGRPRRRHGLPRRPRHGGADRAARGTRRFRRRDRQVHPVGGIGRRGAPEARTRRGHRHRSQ